MRLQYRVFGVFPPSLQSHMAKLGDITSLVTAIGQNQVILIDWGMLGSIGCINNYVLTILILDNLLLPKRKIKVK